MSSVSFTCNSCAVEFTTSDQQRYHMKTDWHRYNLKRRVNQLPTVTSDEFAEKLQLLQREQAEDDVDEFGFTVFKPKTKHRHNHHHHHKHGHDDFKHSNLSDLDTNDDHEYHHNRSIDESIDEHLDNIDEHAHSEALALKKMLSVESVTSQFSNVTLESELAKSDFGEDTISEYSFTTEGSNYDQYTTDDNDDIDSHSDVSLDVDTINDELSITRCIFCSKQNYETEKNVKHMFASHGLYIPERSYLIDLPGLLNFLINTIVVDYCCLCCSFEGSSLYSIRDHINSKRHAKMPFETTLEKEMFAPFYDFSLTVENPIAKAKSSKTLRFAEETEEFDKDIEFILPDGSKLGSRTDQLKQNKYKPRRSLESAVTVNASDRRLNSGITEKQFKKGLKKMQQLEKRAVDDRLRKDVKRMNFLKHYRDDMLQ